MDISPFWDELDKGYWGFDASAVPLNGKLWFPTEAEGPLPLVVCVHGNHEPRDFSEFGYDYLGDFLASKGYVFASIDENFLNGDSSGENDARGILLLEHAKAILAWSEEPGNPLYGRMDGSAVLLVGHSRGGEAVVHAATLNRLSRYPEDMSVALDYGLPIRGIVALAPAEGQYRPAGRRFFPDDVDFLVVQGSLDGDVAPYMGLRFYSRMSPTSSRFKASLWIQGANHAQFNSSWSKSQDPSPTFRGSLIGAEEQRSVTMTAVAAFAEASTGRDTAMRDFFTVPGAASRALPAGDYRIQSASGDQTVLASFDEDADPGSASLDGWTIAATGFSEAKETEQLIYPKGTEAKLLPAFGLENILETWTLRLVVKEPDKKAKGRQASRSESPPETPRLALSGPPAAADAILFDLGIVAWTDLEGAAGPRAEVAVLAADGRSFVAPLSDFHPISLLRPQWQVMIGSASRLIPETVRVEPARIPGWEGGPVAGLELRFPDKARFEIYLDNVRLSPKGLR